MADSNSGEYIENYDPNDPVIPITKSVENKGYYVMYKGVDPAGYGLKNRDALHRTMMKFSREVKKMDIHYPSYTISTFRKKTAVLGSRIPVETYAKKYAPRSKGMSPTLYQQSDHYDIIVYLKIPETRSSDYIASIFSEMNKTELKNYVCIKKFDGKTLIYFNAENEGKLLEMIDKFGDSFDIDNLSINEEKYITF